MDDFSFVGAGGSQGRSSNNQQRSDVPQSASAHGANNRPVFQIPSFREVQAAQQSRAANNNFFKPTGVASSLNHNGPHGAPAAGAAGPPVQAPPSQVMQPPPPKAAPSIPAAQPRGPQLAIPTYVQGQAQGPSARGPMPALAALHPTGAPGGAGPASQWQGPAAAPPSSGAAPAAPMHVQQHAYAPAAAYQQPPMQQQHFQQPHQHFQQQPQQPVVSNAIVVSKRQQGNPVLRHIRNVRWVFGDIVPDYVLGQNACALFLSLRYHLLHPDYILHRIKQLQRAYALRIVLCHVDVDDMVKPLGDITKAAVINDCTLVCAWSPEECARYLETFKSYETKPASSIQERVDHDYVSRLTAAVTCVRGINRTDAVTLGGTFGSLAAMMRGTAEEFSACPGIGPTKVQRLVDTFHQPFRRPARPAQPAQGQQQQQEPGSGSQQQQQQQQQPPGSVPAAPAVVVDQDRMGSQTQAGAMGSGASASAPGSSTLANAAVPAAREHTSMAAVAAGLMTSAPMTAGAAAGSSNRPAGGLPTGAVGIRMERRGEAEASADGMEVDRSTPAQVHASGDAASEGVGGSGAGTQHGPDGVDEGAGGSDGDDDEDELALAATQMLTQAGGNRGEAGDFNDAGSDQDSEGEGDAMPVQYEFL